MRREKNLKLKENWKKEQKILYSHSHQHNKSNKIFSTVFKERRMKITFLFGVCMCLCLGSYKNRKFLSKSTMVAEIKSKQSNNAI